MLRIHFSQQWFKLSDPAVEEVLYDTPKSCELADRHDAGQVQCFDEGQAHGGHHGGASV